MLSKYLRHPSELELMSASQFTKIYTTSTTRIKHDEVEENYEHSEDYFEDCKPSDLLLNCIITGDGSKVKLPQHFEICVPLPSENKFMRKRRKPADLRYHKVNQDNQHEKWMLSELMLYTPFR